MIVHLLFYANQIKGLLFSRSNFIKYMKIILCTIVFFYTVLVFSQNNYIIHYKIEPTHGSIEESEEVKNSRLKYLYQDLDEALLSLKGKLIINGSASSFVIESEYSKNPRALRLAKSYAGNAEYYYGIDDSLNVIKKSFLNEDFFIINNFVLDWTITDEFKMVDNYKCFKAIAMKSLIIKGKEQKHQITAWFCPEVPISFGPKEFRGLPGLIFELFDDKIKFNLDKIELKFEKIILNKKVNKDFITQKEFDKIVAEKSGDFLNNKND